jgi:hypothetical protein
MLETEPSDRSNRSVQFRTDALHRSSSRRRAMTADDYNDFWHDSARTRNADRFIEDYRMRPVSRPHLVFVSAKQESIMLHIFRTQYKPATGSLVLD